MPRLQLDAGHRELLALAEFASGTAWHRALRDLDDMRRIAASLGRAGIGPEALPLADEAARAVARSWRDGYAFCAVIAQATKQRERWRDPGPIAMGSSDMVTLRELALVHDLQRIATTRREVVRANAEAIRALWKYANGG